MKINKLKITYKYNNLSNDIIKYFENDAINTRNIYMKDPFWKEYEKDIEVSEKNHKYSSIEINGDTIFLNTYILNKNKCNYDVLEKFVFESACYQLAKLNKSISDDNITVEFWLSKEKYNYGFNSNFHYDASETDQVIHNKLVSPIVTTVSYFTNCTSTPTLITNICKNVTSVDNEFWFSFPDKNTQTSFTGATYLHGPCFTKKNSTCKSSNDRYILNIQIFDKPVSNRVLYTNEFAEVYDRDTDIFQFVDTTNVNKIKINSASLTSLYNNLGSTVRINNNSVNTDDYRFKINTDTNLKNFTFSKFDKIFQEENISYSDIVCISI